MLLLPLGIAWFGAIAMMLLDGRRRWAGWMAVGCLAAGLATMIALATSVLQHGPVQMVTGGWPVGVGIRLRADALGIVFALVSLAVLLAALAYEVAVGVHDRTMPALVLFLATGLTGLFLTADAFNFYVFFEISMATSFVLASYRRSGRQIRAALTFMVVNLLGSVIFLTAIAALYHVTGTLDMDQIARQVAGLQSSSVILISTLLLIAFSLKLGLFPFHFWVPVVYRDTWPAVTAILSGALANIGSYGLLRFGAGLLPRELAFGAVVLLVLGSASIVYGGHQAVSSRTASEALAYSSIGQAGYILIALGVGGPIGFSAAVLYAVVNSLNKTLLFLSAGLRGWLVGAAFAVGAFSVAGVPPSAGFLGKAALFRAGIDQGSVTLVALIFVGGALSFVYMFQLYQHTFWRPGQALTASTKTSPLASRVLVFMLAGIVVLLGAWPEPLLWLSRQAGDVLMRGTM